MSHDLNPPITARFIRFRPVSWVKHISMRVELYGCHSGMTCVQVASITCFLLHCWIDVYQCRRNLQQSKILNAGDLNDHKEYIFLLQYLSKKLKFFTRRIQNLQNTYQVVTSKTNLRPKPIVCDYGLKKSFQPPAWINSIRVQILISLSTLIKCIVLTLENKCFPIRQ